MLQIRMLDLESSILQLELEVMVYVFVGDECKYVAKLSEGSLRYSGLTFMIIPTISSSWGLTSLFDHLLTLAK